MSYQNEFKVVKTLSRNDTGESKSHQSGITIPKSVVKTGIFPELGHEILNPRMTLKFIEDDGTVWDFQFIYYNDVFFGKPKKISHNEFRLTCVNNYIKKHNIKAGDEVWFAKVGVNEILKIGHTSKQQEITIAAENHITKIVLGKNWKSLRY